MNFATRWVTLLLACVVILIASGVTATVFIDEKNLCGWMRFNLLQCCSPVLRGQGVLPHHRFQNAAPAIGGVIR